MNLSKQLSSMDKRRPLGVWRMHEWRLERLVVIISTHLRIGLLIQYIVWYDTLRYVYKLLTRVLCMIKKICCGAASRHVPLLWRSKWCGGYQHAKLNLQHANAYIFFWYRVIWMGISSASEESQAADLIKGGGVAPIESNKYSHNISLQVIRGVQIHFSGSLRTRHGSMSPEWSKRVHITLRVSFWPVVATQKTGSLP